MESQHFLIKHKITNMLQLMAMFILLSSLIVYIALLIGGEIFAVFALTSVLFLYIGHPYIGPAFILKMYKAEPVPYDAAPVVYDLIDELSSRAGLSYSPKLYYIASGVINSFTVGRQDNSVIALSDGILRSLNYEELAGVIGHEISHIKSNDVRVMMFADIAGRILKVLSLLGQVLILLSLPLMLIGDFNINWLPFLIIVFAPLLSDLIQLGLSRIREYEADIGSAMLLGDARPLASALKKIDEYEHNYLSSIFSPVNKIPEPSLLRTHPKTGERISRLLAMQSEIKHTPVKHDQEILSGNRPHHYIVTGHRKPRRHFNGFWY